MFNTSSITEKLLTYKKIKHKTVTNIKIQVLLQSTESYQCYIYRRKG